MHSSKPNSQRSTSHGCSHLLPCSNLVPSSCSDNELSPQCTLKTITTPRKSHQRSELFKMTAQRINAFCARQPCTPRHEDQSSCAAVPVENRHLYQTLHIPQNKATLSRQCGTRHGYHRSLPSYLQSSTLTGCCDSPSPGEQQHPVHARDTGLLYEILSIFLRTYGKLVAGGAALWFSQQKVCPSLCMTAQVNCVTAFVALRDPFFQWEQQEEAVLGLGREKKALWTQ